MLKESHVFKAKGPATNRLKDSQVFRAEGPATSQPRATPWVQIPKMGQPCRGDTKTPAA